LVTGNEAGFRHAGITTVNPQSLDTLGDLVRVAQKGSPMPGKKEITLWGEEISQRFSALVAGDSAGTDDQGIK
jgi:hypothetical protein